MKWPGQISFYRWMIYLVIPLISLLMHLHILNRDLKGVHVWRQAWTQLNIRNFYEEDFNLLNPRINDLGDQEGLYRMEFPLMQWLMAGTYKVFGEHLILSRLLSFLIFLGSCWGMVALCGLLFRARWLQVLVAWAFTFSPALFYYSVNPLPDNFALLSGIWGLFFCVRGMFSGKWLSWGLGALFLGLATLCKLPFATFYGFPFVYFLLGLLPGKWKRGVVVRKGGAGSRNGGSSGGVTSLPGMKMSFLAYGLFLLSMVPAVLWYADAMRNWKGNQVLTGILNLDWNQMPLILRHHVTHVFPGYLLNYFSVPFFLIGLWTLWKGRFWRSQAGLAFSGLGLGVWAFFVFELNAIGLDHDYYLFPFLPGLFLIVALGLWRLGPLIGSGEERRGAEPQRLLGLRFPPPLVRLAFVGGFLLMPAFAFFVVNDRWDEDPLLNPDLERYQTELREAVPDSSLVIAGGDVTKHLFFYYLHKRGWGFAVDSTAAKPIDEGWFQLCVDRGAEFLYSDSRAVEALPGVEVWLDSLLLERGSIRVWALGRRAQD